MSHEASISPEHDGAREALREAPGELPVHGPLRRAWERMRLVPLLLLVACVIAAAIVGGMTQAEADRRAALPPATAGATAPAAADGAECAPAQPPLPAEQPWQGEAREASDAVYQEATAGLQQPVIEGRDGWLFWSDYQWQNFSQGLGRRVQTTEEMDAWSSHYQGVADALEAEGIRFHILIAPAKWDAYRDQLPEWADGIQGSTTYDYLRVAHPELPLIDVREAVRHGAAEADTYERENSHWTAYGGHVAWAQAARCLASAGGPLAGIRAPELAGVETVQGINEFAPYGYVDGIPAGHTRPVYAEAPSPMTLANKDGEVLHVDTAHPTDMLEMPARTVTERPQSEATALVFRDSFGGGIAPGLQAAFAETTQISHGIGTGEAADIQGIALEQRPDVVILEMTERYFYFAPGIPAPPNV